MEFLFECSPWFLTSDCSAQSWDTLLNMRIENNYICKQPWIIMLYKHLANTPNQLSSRFKKENALPFIRGAK